MAEVLGITLNQVNWQIRTAQAWLRWEMETPESPQTPKVSRIAFRYLKEI